MMDEKIIEMLSAIQNDLSSMKIQIDERFSKLESELAEIKEDTEITRSAVNSLCEWAEAASDVIGVRFPVE